MPDWIGLAAAAAVPLFINWALGYVSFDSRTVRRIKADRALLEATDHDSPQCAALEKDVADRFDHLMLYREVAALRKFERPVAWFTVALITGAVCYAVYLVTVRGNVEVGDIVLVIAWTLGIAGAARPVVTGEPMFAPTLEAERIYRLEEARKRLVRRAERAARRASRK